MKINPQDISSLINKGIALRALRQHEKAIECFDSALQLDPDRYDVWRNKASVLQELGKHDGAAKCYQESRRLISGASK